MSDTKTHETPKHFHQTEWEAVEHLEDWRLQSYIDGLQHDMMEAADQVSRAVQAVVSARSRFKTTCEYAAIKRKESEAEVERLRDAVAPVDVFPVTAEKEVAK